MHTIETEVGTTIDRMTAALERGDLEGVVHTYEPDAVVLFEPGIPVSGEEAIRQAFEEFIAADPRFEYGDHEVVVAGDIALHLMPWKMRATAPGGSSVEQEGLSVAVLRRQPGGGWRMVIDNPHGQR